MNCLHQKLTILRRMEEPDTRNRRNKWWKRPHDNLGMWLLGSRRKKRRPLEMSWVELQWKLTPCFLIADRHLSTADRPSATVLITTCLGNIIVQNSPLKNWCNITCEKLNFNFFPDICGLGDVWIKSSPLIRIKSLPLDFILKAMCSCTRLSKNISSDL